MQGYRTVIFNIAMTLAAGGTVQFSDLPPAAQHWLTLAVMAWGLIAIFLRLITTSPIGKRAAAEFEATTGISQADLSEIADAVSAAVNATIATMPKPAAPSVTVNQVAAPAEAAPVIPAAA